MLLRGCLYGRRDGTFFIPTLKSVYMGGGIHVQSQHKIVPAKRTECLYICDKIELIIVETMLHLVELKPR